MILDSTLTLLATLAGAVSANQPEVHIDYSTWNVEGVETKPSPFRVALNNTSDVTILAPPTTVGEIRDIKHVGLYNKDTASATVTVKSTDGTTQRLIARVVLATLESLHYETSQGWYVLTSSGAIKQSSGISGPASSTANAVPRWNGTTGTILLDSGVIVDNSNNVTGVGTLNTSGTVTAPTVLAGTGNGIIGIVRANTTSDQTISSSTTLANATTMTHAVAANETWITEFNCDFSSANLNAGGLKLAVTVPASPTYVNIRAAVVADDSTVAGGDAYRTTLTGGAALDFGTAEFLGVSQAKILVSVTLENGANAGNVQMQLAQSASSGTGVKLVRGSSFVGHRVA